MTTEILTIHHLGRSQSERIVWLCEELAIPYQLHRYERRTDNRAAPAEYKALHVIGAAPVITDGPLVLAESGAIVEYLIEKYGEGRLRIQHGQSGWTDYLYWFHFSNGTLQPALLRLMFLERLDPSHTSATLPAARQRFDLITSALDKRLEEAPYLAGHELTAADIMTVFSLTTMRIFRPYELASWPNVLAYLQRIGHRPAYQRAMQIAEPDMAPMLGASVSGS